MIGKIYHEGKLKLFWLKCLMENMQQKCKTKVQNVYPKPSHDNFHKIYQYKIFKKRKSE